MATFAEQMEKIMAGHTLEAETEKEAEAIYCKVCFSATNVNEAGYCSECQADLDRGYAILSKAGRCANGMELGSGVLFHAIPLNECGDPQWTPLCGQAPGRRSAGWSSWRPAGRTVTCPRCLKKLGHK